MNPILRNALAILAGLVVGSLVNMGLIQLGSVLIPPPEGADMSTLEGLRDSIATFEPIHFLPPFLAHALGTLAGAFVAAKLAASHPLRCALGIGAAFLVGGVFAARMIGGPLWFSLVDLIFAYLPMGYLGGLLAGGRKRP